MALLVADREIAFSAQNVPAPFTTGEVWATPTVVPLWVQTASEPEEDQSAARVVFVDRATGAWSLTLPWPSTCTPSSAGFIIRRSTGVAFTGTVPEGVAGPLTVWDLVQHYGWLLVASSLPPAPLTVAVRPVPGAKAFSQVTVGTTATLLLAANALRKVATIVNN